MGGTFEDGASLGGDWYFGSLTDEAVDLWRTDGTVAGTTLVVPDILRRGFTFPFEIVRFGDRLAFAGSTDAEGIELWTSDGTASGTGPVVDIRPGVESANPRALTAAGDLLFFLADDGVHGGELWVSDGSATGTRLVVDLMPGPDALPFIQMKAVGDALYFSDQRHLWRTDGAEVVLVEDFGLGRFLSLHAAGSALFVFLDESLLHVDDASGQVTLAGSFVRHPSYPATLGSRLTFSIFDEVTGSQLWISDGTGSGTVPISDFSPSDEAVIAGNYEGTDRIWLQIYDREHGAEPWLSEGTLASTRLVRDLNEVGNRGSNPFSITAMNDRWLFFRRT